jgi:hypothetical protein
MAEWKDWRKALSEGKTVGAIWHGPPGAHLQNEIQRVHEEKVAVAAGNRYGSAWVQAFPEKVVVIFYDAGGKETDRKEFATPVA